MIRAFRLLLLTVATVSVPFAWRALNCDFRVGKMAMDLPFDPRWEVSQSLPEELGGFLSQPFFYLSHGGQSFVLESADKQFILKLFRKSRTPHPWRNFLRSKIRGRNRSHTPEQKTERLFSACHLAHEKASDLTGLIAIHLNRTQNLFPIITIRDRIARTWLLDLNRCSFALQWRGTLIREAFCRAVAENDREQFMQLAKAFASLLKERTSRNIRNSDTKVGPNFGFIGQKAIEWDFGNYWLDPNMENPKARRAEMQLFIQNHQEYLQRIAPGWPIDWESLLQP